MGELKINPKTYTGRELETIFLRPSLTGPDARDLGIRIMYNMPVPTTLNYWGRSDDLLRKYQCGWQGGDPAQKYQKEITLSKVKAELGYCPEAYFGMIQELITNSSNINLGDLSGTAIEEAELTLFRRAIAESIRATMWLGDTTRTGDTAKYYTFDGFLKRITADVGTGDTKITQITYPAMDSDPDAAETALKALWVASHPVLKALKPQGELVYLVTSDVYANYEDSLDSVVLESAYAAKQNGRSGLTYRGIPVIDVGIAEYLPEFATLPQSFAILTHRQNMAVAFNTVDYPGMNLEMWYSHNEMENRYRAKFMAGVDYLLPELITFGTVETTTP